ncbi:hypothetical protein ISR94_02615 [Candidatus Microgenomates bacterium]|nr:hypothetical protein [Candidatus Microgenomates bacterium]
MNKVGIIIASITVLIIGAGAYFLTKPKPPIELPQYNESEYNYFWGNGCPHCAVVAEFMDSWEGKDKINLNKFEVWYDDGNAELMNQKAEQVCKLSKNELAVPLLITPDGVCLKGDEPVIEYFKELKFE